MNPKDMREQYRKLALEWQASQGVSRVANRIFDKHLALYRKIRDTPEGAEVIAELMDDPAPAERLLAASHSLSTDPAKAERVLEDIEAEGTIFAIDAKYTLRGFREGTLNLD